MSSRIRDHLLMLLVVLAVVGLAALGSRNAVFRSFMSWPTGATWSNMIASAEWVALIGVTTWYFRDRVGRRLAEFVHRHQAHHRSGTREEIVAQVREHVAAELTAAREEIVTKLEEHHRRIIASINGGAHDDD